MELVNIASTTNNQKILFAKIQKAKILQTGLIIPILAKNGRRKSEKESIH